eukprot:403359340
MQWRMDLIALNDKNGNQYTKLVGFWCTYISQPQYENQLITEWRNNLQSGMRLMAYNGKFWHAATVIQRVEKSSSQMEQYVRIGFQAIDANGVYFGQPDLSDHYFSINSYVLMPMLVFEAYQGNLSLVKFLAEEIESSIITTNLEYQFQGEEAGNKIQIHSLFGSPLYLACEAGNYDIAEYLIKQGANLDTRTQFDISPLIIAVLKNNAQIVKLLLENGAKIDINTEDKDAQYGLKQINPNIESILDDFMMKRISRFLYIQEGTFTMTFQNMNRNIMMLIITNYV